MSVQPSLGHLLGDWRWDPALSAVLVLAGGLYALGVIRLIRRSRSAWPYRRVICFAAGLLTIAIALQSGVDEIGDQELLSVHTAQHMLLVLLAPVLLLCGAPVRLALAAATRSTRKVLVAVLSTRLVGVLTRPLTGCVLFAAVMLATHSRLFFEAALDHPALHALEHAAYFWSGIVLLAPLIAADPLAHRPGPLARFGWLMAAMTAMAIPGALLTFADGVSYPFYLGPARALGRSALADEHLAGAIMWVGGGIAMFALAIALTFAAMLEEERRQLRRERYEPDSSEIAWRPGTARG
ncbi:MAG TPA: cytochrome c oxidase assembly protein [Solirubrobacteraceae bacterium]|nr:cytochrome c oxidase assembly protein [Solirubrobacteraceae bacterium]